MRMSSYVVVSAVSAEFCYANVNADISMKSWYAALLAFEVALFVGAIASIIAVQRNKLLAHWHHLYMQAAQYITQFLVFVALSRNLYQYVSTNELKFCGLEDYQTCTDLAGKLQYVFLKAFATVNLIGAIAAALGAEVMKSEVEDLIHYRPIPFSWSIPWIVSFGKKLALLVVDRFVMLLAAIFSPGMVLLEVIPYTGDCVADDKLELIFGHVVTHGVMFGIILAMIPLDKLRKDKDWFFTKAAVGIFVFSGILMFFIQMFASASNGDMWTIWAFSVAYPSIVSLSGKFLEFAENVAFVFFTVNTSSSVLVAAAPSWSFPEYYRFYLAANPFIPTFEAAMASVETALDTRLWKFNSSELVDAVTREFAAAEEAENSTARPSGSLDADCRKVILALTTILPPNSFRSKVFGRTQFFDRLSDCIESYFSSNTLKAWEQEKASQLMPFVVLLYKALEQLPLADRSHTVLRRFSHNEAIANWFEDHRGAPILDDEFDPRGADLFPVVVRSLVACYSDPAHRNTKKPALLNDACITFNFSKAKWTELLAEERNKGEVNEERWVDPPTCDSATVCPVGPRSIASMASKSWRDAGRGDVILLPGFAAAVSGICVEHHPSVVVLSNDPNQPFVHELAHPLTSKDDKDAAPYGTNDERIEVVEANVVEAEQSTGLKSWLEDHQQEQEEVFPTPNARQAAGEVSDNAAPLAAPPVPLRLHRTLFSSPPTLLSSQSEGSPLKQ